MDARLSDQEVESLFALAERLTGACHAGNQRRTILINNVLRRIENLGLRSLADYLDRARSDPAEHEALLSALTIHTTHWFREMDHFKHLEALARVHASRPERLARPFRAWSAACSTGQEAYSIALVLERIRRENPQFEYEVLGSDIDPVSVKSAARAIYRAAELEDIDPLYRPHVLLGTAHAAGALTLSKDVRARCRFETRDLCAAHEDLLAHFDVVVCRNVLIYFSGEDALNIVRRLGRALIPSGTLILGHSECIDLGSIGFSQGSHSTYVRLDATPDKGPIPSKARARGWVSAPRAFRPEILAIGASTGGIEALSNLLRGFAHPGLPVLIVQHINASFARDVAEQIARVSGLRLGALKDGDALKADTLYMAPGDVHIQVNARPGREPTLRLSDAHPVHGCRPSVDVLFQSLVEAAPRTLALLLTGMGSDGASGLEALRNRGAVTAVQDEGSCAVFGMPREAIARGAADFIGTPAELRALIVDLCRQGRAA